MLPRELPRELVHSIFDHLSDDIESLNNCAVASRSWTYPCVERLLRIGVVFDLSQPRIESLEKLISTHSHLSESIISVKFVVRSPQETPPQDISNRLISLIQNLRHVRHVAFKSFHGSFIDDTFLPTIKDLLRRSTIESLSLVDVLVFFSDQIYELLLLPPNLNTLTLSNVGFSILGIRIDPTVPMGRIPPLRTLTLASYTYETTLRGVCNIFKDEEGDSTIRHLLFSDIEDPNLVIEAVSGSVEELTVLVHSVVDDHPPSYVFDLVAMPNLKILEFPFAHIAHVRSLLTRGLDIFWYSFPLEEIRITNIKEKEGVWESIKAFNKAMAKAKKVGLGSLALVEFRFNRSHWDPPQNMISESMHVLRVGGVNVRTTNSYAPMPKPIEGQGNQIKTRHPRKHWDWRARVKDQ